METLQEFLQRKTNPIFSLKITDDSVIFQFDEISSGVHSAVTLENMKEVMLFNTLLGGRVCKLKGNIIRNATVVAINIKNYGN
jgi:hypothetical protein